MRRKRTGAPVAGGPAGSRSSVRHRRRNDWVTAAAAILFVQGGLGILYAPSLMDGGLGPLQPVAIVIVGVSALGIVAGIGLLRLDEWARFAAGALSVVALVLMYAPVLVVAVTHGAWLDLGWLGAAGDAAVPFAVLRRWPTGLRRRV